MTIWVAITGALCLRRKDAISLIEKTNAKYANRLTRQTTYLVGSRLDTHKAHLAIRLQIPIISEMQMLEYLSYGEFPEQAQMTLWSYSAEVGTSGLVDQTSNQLSWDRFLG